MVSMASTRALIHLDRLRRNIRAIRSLVGPSREMCIAVKADAYGHGALPVAQAACEAGATWLCVATCEEATELRDGGITASILLLSPPLPEEIDELTAGEISSVISDPGLIPLFSRSAAKIGKPAKLHLAIDTGMSRIGCRGEDAVPLAREIAADPLLVLEGIFTHFAAADTDPGFTRLQIERFDDTLADLAFAGPSPTIHAANSAAILGHPEAWYDMVRPGIAVYGYLPSGAERDKIRVEPVMEFVSKIIFLKSVPAHTPLSYGMTHVTQRDTVIGTVAAGYGDGYNRLLSNRGKVAIGGRLYPVVGRVCMDQFLVDLGRSSAVSLYDDVVLFGPTPPSPTAAEIALLTGTIPYEVTCSIGKRAHRIYRS